MTITRINQFQAKPDKAERLFGFLTSVIEAVRESPGCIHCRLLRSLEDPARFVIIEEWESVEAHQNAAKAIPPEMLAEAREMFATPPQGMYFQG
ncbi:MAG: antibiotic biosynthesis monooxygenase [Caldilineales bacterium]|nr:antibiotic biosynthesis monooxygenase [Caldilineales bacterium]